jgi:hypothetical protein
MTSQLEISVERNAASVGGIKEMENIRQYSSETRSLAAGSLSESKQRYF